MQVSRRTLGVAAVVVIGLGALGGYALGELLEGEPRHDDRRVARALDWLDDLSGVDVRGDARMRGSTLDAAVRIAEDADGAARADLVHQMADRFGELGIGGWTIRVHFGANWFDATNDEDETDAVLAVAARLADHDDVDRFEISGQDDGLRTVSVGTTEEVEPADLYAELLDDQFWAAEAVFGATLRVSALLSTSAGWGQHFQADAGAAVPTRVIDAVRRAELERVTVRSGFGTDGPETEIEARVEPGASQRVRAALLDAGVGDEPGDHLVVVISDDEDEMRLSGVADWDGWTAARSRVEATGATCPDVNFDERSLACWVTGDDGAITAAAEAEQVGSLDQLELSIVDEDSLWAKVAGTPAEIGVTVPVVAAIRQDDATGVTTDGRTIHVTIDPDDPLDAERTDALIDEIRAVGWDGDLTFTVNDRHVPIAMGLSVTFTSSADGPARDATSDMPGDAGPVDVEQLHPDHPSRRFVEAWNDTAR